MYACRTLADSIGPHRIRLWTTEITYPRFVHEELMTHRVFSRNTSSSRAVPVAKVIEQVKTNPVIPLSFGRNERGMVSTAQLHDQQAAQAAWLAGRDMAVNAAETLMDMTVHKQFVNRLLMPYTWITTIVSATDWQNFFALRTAPDVQPEMRKIACMMVGEYYFVSQPKELEYGQWHRPFGNDNDLRPLEANMVSAARCAAVSYLRQDDTRSIDDWLKLFSNLVTNGHMSPLEHVAQAVPPINSSGNFSGWKQLRHNYQDVRQFTLSDADRVIQDYMLSVQAQKTAEEYHHGN